MSDEGIHEPGQCGMGGTTDMYPLMIIAIRRTKSARLTIGVCMLMLLTACAQLTTTVDVSCEPEIAREYTELELQLIYQASKIDHPPSSQVPLDSNPAKVLMYNAPISLGVNGGPRALRFVIPSPFQWGKAEAYWDRIGRGWVIVEKGRLRFGYDDVDKAPTQLPGGAP